jgi:hypothetical protein
MKQLTILILLGTILTSCVTERKRAKICLNCPTKTETIVRDSIVRKDSTVLLPGERITEYVRIECPDGAKPTVTTKSKSGKRGRLETKLIEPNTLQLDCVIDSAAVAFSWNESHRTTQTVQTLPCPEVCYSGWDIVWSVLAGIGFVSTVAFFVFVMSKRKNSNNDN